MVKHTISTKFGPQVAKSVRSVTKQVRCPSGHHHRVGGRANTRLGWGVKAYSQGLALSDSSPVALRPPSY